MEPTQHDAVFEWDNAKEEAAFLLADGQLSDESIAVKVGVSRAAITRWKRHQPFQDKIKEHQQEIARTVLAKGIAQKAHRVRAQHTRWLKMLRVIEERAADPEMQNVPGGQTGLLVRKVKAVGRGDNFQLLDEYEVDTGLLKELREHEILAAKELGQWEDKLVVEGGDPGKPVNVKGEMKHDLSPELAAHLAALEAERGESLGDLPSN